MVGDPPRIEILGTTRLVAREATRPLPRGRQGQLLRQLLLQPNEWISVDDLSAALWPDADCHERIQRLRVVAARLRRHLPVGISVEAAPRAYRLHASPASIDRLEFEALVDRAQRGDGNAAARALALWRGEPYADFADTVDVQSQRNRLAALRRWLESIVSSHDKAPAAPTRSSPPFAMTATTVPRPRLLDRLPRIGATRLIALTAPAGYGKSVLLAQWAERERPLVGWMRATSDHNDPTAFRDGLITALSLATGGTLPGHASAEATTDWVTRLINRLVEAGCPMGLILDDAHRITNVDVLTVLSDLVRRGPQHLTVAIGSRQMLPIPTGRLAATGDMVTLTAPDLAFTPPELGAALEVVRSGRGSNTYGGRSVPEHGRAGNPSPTPETVDELHAITEGWPLAALVVGGTATGCAANRLDLDRATQLVDDALIDRIVCDLPPDLARLMTDTALFDTFDEAASNVVSGRSDTKQALETLTTRYQLLHRHGPRYRHHPLLARALRRRQAQHAPRRAVRRHNRAARWFVLHDEPDAALTHAAAAGNTPLVAAALGPAVRRAATSADSGVLRHWAETVPLPPPNMTTTESRELALLASALLPAHGRHGWAWQTVADVPSDICATLEAVDLLRAGRCAEALSAIARARAHADRRPSALVSDVQQALLRVTAADCWLLLEGAPNPAHPVPTPPTTRATPWPWLTLWLYGQHAMHAYIAGETGLAMALLDHADALCRDLHPSWWLLSDGSAQLTRALLDLEHRALREDDHEEPNRAVTDLEAIASRADAVPMNTGMAILARYALQRAHQRAGDDQAAAACLAEADAAAARFPQLTFLSAVRTRLAPDDTTAAGSAGMDALTQRERTVLDHLDSDLTLAEIAERLYVSVHTVKPTRGPSIESWGRHDVPRR